MTKLQRSTYLEIVKRDGVWAEFKAKWDGKIPESTDVMYSDYQRDVSMVGIKLNGFYMKVRRNEV